MVGQMLHCKVVTHNIYFLRSFNHIWLNHIHQGKISWARLNRLSNKYLTLPTTHTCFIAVNFSIHKGGFGGSVKFLPLWGGRHKKYALSLEGGGVKKDFNRYFPHLPPHPPINNDHSLNKVVTKARRELGNFPPRTNLLIFLSLCHLIERNLFSRAW